MIDSDHNALQANFDATEQKATFDAQLVKVIANLPLFLKYDYFMDPYRTVYMCVMCALVFSLVL